jgi:beta-glucosidase
MFSGYLLNRDRMSMKKKRLFLSGLAAFLILFAPIASSTYAAESEPVEVTNDVSEDVGFDEFNGIPAEYDLVTFDDIQGHWAQNNIEILATAGIIHGKTESLFVPDASITRAEFIALIVRALEYAMVDLTVEDTAQTSFTDLEAGAWYVEEVQYAAQLGIVKGTGDGKFNPNSNITREQVAAIIGRTYALYDGEYSVDADSILSTYTDKDTISDWAKNDVALLVVLKVINGVSTYKMGPLENATRAQAAVMLNRFLNYYFIHMD